MKIFNPNYVVASLAREKEIADKLTAWFAAHPDVEYIESEQAEAIARSDNGSEVLADSLIAKVSSGKGWKAA